LTRPSSPRRTRGGWPASAGRWSGSPSTRHALTKSGCRLQQHTGVQGASWACVAASHASLLPVARRGMGTGHWPGAPAAPRPRTCACVTDTCSAKAVWNKGCVHAHTKGTDSACVHSACARTHARPACVQAMPLWPPWGHVCWADPPCLPCALAGMSMRRMCWPSSRLSKTWVTTCSRAMRSTSFQRCAPAAWGGLRRVQGSMHHAGAAQGTNACGHLPGRVPASAAHVGT